MKKYKTVVLIIVVLTVVFFINYFINTIILGYHNDEITIIEQVGLIKDKSELDKISTKKYNIVNIIITSNDYNGKDLTIIVKDHSRTLDMNLPLYMYIAKINETKILIGTVQNIDLKVGETIKIKYKGNI